MIETPTEIAAADDPVELVRAEVVAMLERGELAPGERLLEARLARRLNIGRNAAREGLRALEQTGIVRIVPNRGAEIRKLELRDALDLYDMRGGLARTAARLAAKRIERSQLEAMAECQGQLRVAGEQDDALLYNKVNRRFHDLVFEGARNARLTSVNVMIQEELNLFLIRTFYSAAAYRKSWDEHQTLLDALNAGDEDAAADAFEAHVIRGKGRLVEGEVAIRF